MKKIIWLMILSVMCGVPWIAQASCDRPVPPAMPDPQQAVTPEMIKAKNEVSEYLSDAKDYLKCVKNSRKHNSMIEEMEGVADTFNAIVRAYKARMNNA